MGPVILFLFILAPNFLRQLVYYRVLKRVNSFGFCVSPETRFMQSKHWLPWTGFLEEVGWGLLWSFSWFVLGLEWLAFGWVSDALLDCVIAYSWSKGKRWSGSFFTREVILPYLIIGPLVWVTGLSISVYSGFAALIGLALFLLV